MPQPSLNTLQSFAVALHITRVEKIWAYALIGQGLAQALALLVAKVR